MVIIKETKQLFVITMLTALLTFFSCKKEHRLSERPAETFSSVKVGGKFYKVKAFGAQAWTIENYDGEGGVSLAAENIKAGFGKYYTQEEALGLGLPPGWRLPTTADYVKLCKSYGIELSQNAYNEDGSRIRDLMSIDTWDTSSGSNASGFNAFPAGFVYYGLEVGQGKFARFWTADKHERLQSYFTIRNDNGFPVSGIRSVGNIEWLSLRFVKDI